MRQRKGPADFLFPRTRQAVLLALLADPLRSWYRSDLAKHLQLPPSSLQRELDGLVQAGLLTRRTEGNRAYFQPDPSCPFLPELRGLIDKTIGIVPQLRRLLDPLKSNIRSAFVFGSVARSAERSESDVDLMVIGNITLKRLIPGLREAEASLSRQVNVHTYTPQELADKVRAKHHFVTAVLASEKVFLVGTSHDLDALLESRTG
jgi:predicted nucleotidyltransferase